MLNCCTDLMLWQLLRPACTACSCYCTFAVLTEKNSNTCWKYTAERNYIFFRKKAYFNLFLSLGHNSQSNMVLLNLKVTTVGFLKILSTSLKMGCQKTFFIYYFPVSETLVDRSCLYAMYYNTDESIHVVL